MRYEITDEIKLLIRNNRKTLNSSLFKYQSQNWIYKNKSIRDIHLLDLCSFLNVNPSNLNLKNFSFDYARNFGKYYTVKKIRFNGLSEKFAEFIGIMLGDGNIYRNRVSVILDSREKQYVSYITSLFFHLFKIFPKIYYPKTNNSVKIYIYSKDLTNLLLDYGLLRGNKVKNNVGVPSWISKRKSFVIACLRGLIDTDGYLHYHKRDKQLYVGFTNHCEKLISNFLSMTNDSLGFYFTRRNKDIRLFRKGEVRVFLDIVELANNRHLKKYKKFLLIKGDVI